MTVTQNAVHCRCTPVAGTRFDPEEGRPPSTAIVEAIAVAEGVGPLELDPVGGDIDLEALDALFRSEAGEATALKTVQIAVRGWNVFVRSDGAVRVCDPTPAVEPAPVFQREIRS